MTLFANIKNIMITALSGIVALLFVLFQIQRGKSNQIEAQNETLEVKNSLLVEVNKANDEVTKKKEANTKLVRETQEKLSDNKVSTVPLENKPTKKFRFGHYDN
jgi:hypothetical protein